MSATLEYEHWNQWANNIAEKAAVSGIVFLQLGSAYLARAEVLAAVGFSLVEADAYLDGEPVEGNRVVLTNLDALAYGAGAARLGKLRAKVHEEAIDGRQFVLQSRAPRLVYASFGSMLIHDAVFATGPARDLWATDPSDGRVFEAELDAARPSRTVLRDALTELGPSVCSRLDRIVYESGDPEVGIEGLDATEVEALKGSGFLDSSGRWRVSDLASFLQRELTDVLDAGRDRAEDLQEIVGEFDVLTSALRRTLRAAARARWGPGWAAELLPDELAAKIVRRASNELVPMAESLGDIRDALSWVSLRELLLLRRTEELGGLGITDAMWKAAERELSAVADRIRFFGHVTIQDKACVSKWSALFSKRLSHTGHLSGLPDGVKSATEAGMLRSVREGLQRNPAFETAAGAAFMDLVKATVRFLRQAADVKSDYTRPFPEGEAPHESALQQHYFWYLGSMGLGDSSFIEVPNISTGRVDVLMIGEGGSRFITEVKRELYNASFEAISKAYFGQAADYQANGAPLCQLLVLDLTSHPRGVPDVVDSVHVETRSVGGSSRSVVIYIVRGNRPSPSKMKAPERHDDAV